jgi:hypothetical protein
MYHNALQTLPYSISKEFFLILLVIYCYRKLNITVIIIFQSPSHEHHLLPPGEKVLVVVSEKEPSSIIAYALR